MGYYLLTSIQKLFDCGNTIKVEDSMDIVHFLISSLQQRAAANLIHQERLLSHTEGGKLRASKSGVT